MKRVVFSAALLLTPFLSKAEQLCVELPKELAIATAAMNFDGSTTYSGITILSNGKQVKLFRAGSLGEADTGAAFCTFLSKSYLSSTSKKYSSATDGSPDWALVYLKEGVPSIVTTGKMSDSDQFSYFVTSVTCK